MLKYVDTSVVFREVPGEITLAINISGCPIRCLGCHSPWLWRDVGAPLDAATLAALVDTNPGITCVSLMGGDAEPESVVGLLWGERRRQAGALKTCWYSGRQLEDIERYILPDALDYVKTGPYIKERGPLDSVGTNQRFYNVVRGAGGGVYFIDKTSIFYV